MKIKAYLSLIIVSLVLVGLPRLSQAQNLSGLILINVEQHGEAWYVNPANQKRYYLGKPQDAFTVMKKLAIGINSSKYSLLKTSIPQSLNGRIVINVDNKGAAYYINPRDKKLYSLGRPNEAFNLMKQLGVGITNAQLGSIDIETDKPQNKNSNQYLQTEKEIQDLVNDQRQLYNLSRLKWNDDIASVAREHSQNQARDNQKIIDQNKICSYPFIHHEGNTFGLHHSDRLSNRNVYYQSASAENIALIPKIRSTRYDSTNIESVDCQSEINKLNKNYELAIETAKTDTEKIHLLEAELKNRLRLTNSSQSIKIISQEFNSIKQIENDSVVGWMNSPGHRKNILNGTYDEAGVGISEVNGYYIITQVFIKRVDCGYKGGTCCQREGYYPYCYIPWSCENNICK
ncbi:MAG: CAP domain-containing protein [bacterium]